MNFREHGAECIPGLALPFLSQLRSLLGPHDKRSAGTRISVDAGIASLLSPQLSLGGLAKRLLGLHVRPVRVLLFDKTAEANWALGWHQDRTICVAERTDTAGFGPWTIKQGMHHVEPPFEIIERMATLRIHLDPVDTNNAPLLIAPGSHRLGRIPIDQIDKIVSRCGTEVCLAEPGDVWAYSTPILHASKRSSTPRRRRVLQVDYSYDALPNGLNWQL